MRTFEKSVSSQPVCMSHSERPALNWFWSGVVILVKVLTVVACLGLAAMVLITCGDVLLRVLRVPTRGAYDLIKLCGAVTVSCAVPLTTAMKGHVSIEYFFHKLGRRGRVVVDSLMRSLMFAGFVCAAWSSFGYGLRFLKNGEVTSTVEIPVFWVPLLMSFAFAVTSLVVLFHMFYPGRELVQS